MRPILLDIDPANASLTGYQNGATGVGPATLATNSAGDSLAHKVTIDETAGADQSANAFLIQGTDADGQTQSEIILGPGIGATVTSLKYFKTVTLISWGTDMGANTVDLGWAAEVVSQTIVLDFYREQAPTVAILDPLDTGTCDFCVEVTNNNPQEWTDQGPEASVADSIWITDGNFSPPAASDIHDALAIWPCRALRVRVDTYASGDEIQATIVQAW